MAWSNAHAKLVWKSPSALLAGGGLIAHQQQGTDCLDGVNMSTGEDGVRAMEGSHAAEGSRKRQTAEKGSDRPQAKRAKCTSPQHGSVSGKLVRMVIQDGAAL